MKNSIQEALQVIRADNQQINESDKKLQNKFFSAEKAATALLDEANFRIKMYNSSKGAPNFQDAKSQTGIETLLKEWTNIQSVMKVIHSNFKKIRKSVDVIIKVN